jgi:hypothetical protein
VDAGARGLCIGRRGFVVEIDRYAIAQRRLGYSMGLILEARGFCIMPSRYARACWVPACLLFNFLTL